MKYSILLSALTQVTWAHYYFDANIVDGIATTTNKYIRASTRPTKYNPIKFSDNPPEDLRDNSTIDGLDARCNQGAFTNAERTDVLTVAAGEEVRVKLAIGATIIHPGPGLVYMSRAPGDDVVAYDGSGDWFKIFEEGVCNTNGDFTTDAWCTWKRDWLAASIPKETPSGEYLMRFEHIGVQKSHVNEPEHFVSCVQVRVTGGGSGSPGPTVSFPGAYKSTDDYANFSIYGGVKDFPFPGPAVWDPASSSDSNSTAASNASSNIAVPNKNITVGISNEVSDTGSSTAELSNDCAVEYV